MTVVTPDVTLGRFRLVLLGAAALGTMALSGLVAAQPLPGQLSAKPSGELTVGRIAQVIGCRAEITVAAEELRQGACRADGLEYRILTFATQDGRDAWLAEARMYGGPYLIGERWVVTAWPPDALPTLREALGGIIEEAAEEHGGGHHHTG